MKRVYSKLLITLVCMLVIINISTIDSNAASSPRDIFIATALDAGMESNIAQSLAAVIAYTTVFDPSYADDGYGILAWDSEDDLKALSEYCSTSSHSDCEKCTLGGYSVCDSLECQAVFAVNYVEGAVESVERADNYNTYVSNYITACTTGSSMDKTASLATSAGTIYNAVEAGSIPKTIQGYSSYSTLNISSSEAAQTTGVTTTSSSSAVVVLYADVISDTNTEWLKSSSSGEVTTFVTKVKNMCASVTTWEDKYSSVDAAWIEENKSSFSDSYEDDMTEVDSSSSSSSDSISTSDLLASYNYSWDSSDLDAYTSLNEANVDDKLAGATYEGLTEEQANAYNNWSANLAYKEVWYITFFRYLQILAGIGLIVWAVFLYVGYWFDRVNNFIDLGVVEFLTLGKLLTSDTEEECTYRLTDLSGGKRTVNSRAILTVCALAVACGTFIVSGALYKLILWIILTVKSWLF